MMNTSELLFECDAATGAAAVSPSTPTGASVVGARFASTGCAVEPAPAPRLVPPVLVVRDPEPDPVPVPVVGGAVVGVGAMGVGVVAGGVPGSKTPPLTSTPTSGGRGECGRG